MPKTLRLTPSFLHLLLSFAEGPKHGYAAMQEIERRTDGRVRLGPSSLYYSIGRLQDAGLLEEVEFVGGVTDPHEERRRYYRLTAAGKKRLRQETQTLAEIVAHARVRGFVR